MATVIRLVLEPFITGVTFVTFFPAVVLAALWAGSRAGWLTVALSLASAWALVEPRMGLVGDPRRDVVVAVAFVLSAGFIASLAGAYRQSLIRLDRTRREVAGDALRLSAAQKAGGIGIMDWDVASGEIYWSEEFRRNWGFDAETKPSYALMLERVHPEDRHLIEQSKDRAWGEGALYEAVYRVPQPDGTIKWLAGRGEVVFGDDGKPARMVGINRDVTAQREAEQRLRESEARFRLMADTAPAPVWMTSADGGVEFINQAFREFLGGRTDLALGEGWLGLMHPDDRAEVERRRAEARETFAPYVFEARFKGADDQWRWVQAHSKPRLDDQGRFAGYIGIAFDITQTREAETALRESEERFRAMADVAPVFLWGVGADGGGLFVNQAFRTFFGFGQEASLSQAWREGIHPDDRDAMVAAHRRALETREPYETLGRFRRADGEWRWFLSRGVPRFDADGGFLGVYGASIDVTEAREAQAGLVEASRRAEALASERAAVLGQLAEGVVVADPDGRIVFVNEAASRLHGVARLDVPPEEYAEAYALLTEAGEPYPSAELPLARAVLKGETVLDARWRIRRPDGSMILAVGNARPVVATDGTRIGAVLTLRDDTARVSAEAALRESEQRFRLIADSAPVPMWVTRPGGGVREFVNQAYVEFLGVSYDEALAFDWRRILHPDDAARIYAESQAGEASGRPFTLEARYRRSDGEWRWLQSRSQPRLGADGEPQGFIGVAFDVTEARRAEAVLRESEERFRLMADSAPVLLSINEPDGTKTFVNRAYVEFWGAPEDEILGRRWREAVHPEDLPTLEAAWTEAMRTRSPFQTHARFRRGDGQWRWLRKDGRVRLGPDGEPLGYLAVSVDVTEAMQVQENLERINDLLSERVAAALAEKEQAEAALLRAQKLEAVGRLTGGVAHDFNNLLTVVVGALDMIIKHPDDVRKRTRMAEAAMAAARRG
ncbi:MAG TPA: PAS domain S-box protein, partial [Caulobacteraceae bacterium]|nr:PAS domain S-box protein [Caulobacteraceae bacterium]